MTILEKIQFEEDWLSEVNLTKENIKIALAGIRATALEQQRQPCEDCISREAVLDIWHTRYSNIREENEEIQYKKIAFELPSVTPKQKVGKWIYKDGQGQFCSECDTNAIWKFNYCPNCGSYNGGEEV